MRLRSVPGEFAFKCLVQIPTCHGWQVSEEYFFTKTEIQRRFGNTPVIWPIEVWEDGTCYAPSQEELE